MNKGSCQIQGTIAYVEQEPFIFSDTIKQNILFGKVFDEKLFSKALEVSCLARDEDQF